MIGQKFLKVGMRGFSPVMANDEWQAPPPIPIVRDETDMIRALQAEFAAVKRQEKTCCLVTIRPDAAEGVSGDVLMSAVGERLSRSLRPYDGLFTFGPDRYLISLPHIKPEDTATVIDRLCGQIVDEPLAVGDDGALVVTVSAGGAMIDPALPLQDNIERAARSI
jgi:GGDEF domain-containing protein